MKYLILSLGSYKFAVNIVDITEIVIPGISGNDRPEQILQSRTINIRDNSGGSKISIPVFDLSEVILFSTGQRRGDFRVIICELNKSRFGLIVDNADEIMRISENEIGSLKSMPEPIKTDFLKGIIEEEERRIFIILPEKIISYVKTVS